MNKYVLPLSKPVEEYTNSFITKWRAVCIVLSEIRRQMGKRRLMDPSTLINTISKSKVLSLAGCNITLSDILDWMYEEELYVDYFADVEIALGNCADADARELFLSYAVIKGYVTIDGIRILKELKKSPGLSHDDIAGTSKYVKSSTGTMAGNHIKASTLRSLITNGMIRKENDGHFVGDILSETIGTCDWCVSSRPHEVE